MSYRVICQEYVPEIEDYTALDGIDPQDFNDEEAAMECAYDLSRRVLAYNDMAVVYEIEHQECDGVVCWFTHNGKCEY